MDPYPTVASWQKMLDKTFLPLILGSAKWQHQCLTKFLTYANKDEQYYALLRIPPCLVWEKKVDGLITVCNTLHTPLSSKPVMVWIIGQVTKRWFFDKNSNTYNQAAIHVRPLTASSFAAARLLTKHLGAPTGTLDDASGELRASCFCSHQVCGVRASETAAFDDVYDAQVEFKSKTGRNGMTPLDAADIQDNDIVLVEATVIRYDKSYSKKDGKSGGKKSGSPDWAFLFQLHHISLLFTPSDKPDIEDECGFSGCL
ncbi:hypothetical protein EWM64_g7944 [Hericium alpestre]|uniref:Uncharacterized protein n=1 Tax=Hericium alpestre TaxID=135208 RepID=A0A4Y9ZMP7_9AGAM|nr:hypothetical protein EWM64_g7944 [Hericium alpestre]